jgi:hypothetical protein
MYNCIYEDGTVLSIPMGPCQPTANGSPYVDAYEESTTVDVIEPFPVATADLSMFVWPLLVFIGLSCFRRK